MLHEQNSDWSENGKTPPTRISRKSIAVGIYLVCVKCFFFPSGNKNIQPATNNHIRCSNCCSSISSKSYVTFWFAGCVLAKALESSTSQQFQNVTQAYSMSYTTSTPFRGQYLALIQLSGKSCRSAFEEDTDSLSRWRNETCPSKQDWIDACCIHYRH